MHLPLLLLGTQSLILAAPATSNETTAKIIPDDGLPSLASLNITSADLYDPDFLTKFGIPEDTDEYLATVAAEGAGKCGMSMGKVKISNAESCYKYLRAAGTKECRVNHRPNKGNLV